jgi:hypothetical protein
MKNFSSLQEDLRKWFSKTDPAGDWKRINSKGEAIGPCAREPGEPKPKCMSRAKRESLTKKERASAVRAKRKHDPNPERKGEPINVSNFGKGKISENMENLNEKNVPTSPEKWAQAKAQAKAKFDVYPSAYANGWAAKKYKEMGGGWKSVSEAVKDKYDEGEYDQEGDMAKSDLRSIMANAQKMHDMIDDADNLPEWVQSKITKAEDYISTVANYMAAEMSEETNIQESGGPVVFKKGDDHIEKYGEDSFALYKDGKKAKYYTSLKSAKESMKEEVKDLSEATYVVKHDGVSDDHADADAKKLFAGKTNVNSHVSRYASSAEKHADMLKSKGFKNVRIQTMNKEEVEQLEEGRPSQRHPLEGHDYHKKTDAELVYIAKDAHKAAEAMKSHNTTAENKYRDQANDSATVRYFRQKNGMPDWYKKKYGHMKESVEPITELSSDTLDRYKEKAKKSSDSLTSQGKYRQANDRTMNVMKATGKQIDKTVANIRKALNRESVVNEVMDEPNYSLSIQARQKKADVSKTVSKTNDATPAQRSLQPNNKTMVRESRRLEIVREAMIDAKKKDQKKKIEKKVEMNGSDKFQSDPELSSQVIKNNV